MRHYTAVIYATGAQTDKSLGIPARICQKLGGRRSCGWYNGHPDYREAEFDLSVAARGGRRNGNVAADVVRAHAQPQELERTDVADTPLEALRESRITEVVVSGPPRPREGRVHQRRAA